MVGTLPIFGDGRHLPHLMLSSHSSCDLKVSNRYIRRFAGLSKEQSEDVLLILGLGVFWYNRIEVGSSQESAVMKISQRKMLQDTLKVGYHGES